MYGNVLSEHSLKMTMPTNIAERKLNGQIDFWLLFPSAELFETVEYEIIGTQISPINAQSKLLEVQFLLNS